MNQIHLDEISSKLVKNKKLKPLKKKQITYWKAWVKKLEPPLKL